MPAEMKNLIIKGTTFEVVDDAARNNINQLVESHQTQEEHTRYTAVSIKKASYIGILQHILVTIIILLQKQISR